MPLAAIIDSQEVISCFLSKEEWEALKTSVKENQLEVIISQTGKIGYLRTSSNGVFHFAHKKGEKPINWKPESRQHLTAKSEVLLGCKEAGWDACPEYNNNKWIADILAVKGKNRIAFEIQWSQQTLEKTNSRQNRYLEDNVRGCWFFKTPPKQILDYNDAAKASHETPVFKIFEDKQNNINVIFNQLELRLKDFVFKLLNGQIKYRENLRVKPKQSVDIEIFKVECYSCNSKQYAYRMPESVLSNCNQKISFDYDNLLDKLFYDIQPIVKKVQKYINQHSSQITSLCTTGNRWDKDYLFCVSCCSPFGGITNILKEKIGIHPSENSEYITIELISNNVIDYSNQTDEYNKYDKNLKNGHWCYSTKKDFC
jgi:hypothetical protein